ncbi:hypothetical protein [Secundilactobacillus folii]|uniref:Lipoprotein n=1 Tax=Secundilactobacillus folii TaxID=2678357 RepID=A0A7X2XUX3_9LACO|nr:hypothetical protein [Secundilactobacillus folii]MTV82068.1 hypothetical protein [Secundilactobacillus folii]
MKRLIRVVLPLALLSLLGGCGSQTKSHSGSSSKTPSSKVAKHSSNQASTSKQQAGSASTSDSSNSNSASSSSTTTGNSSSKTSNATSGSAATSTTKSQQRGASAQKASPAVSQQTIASRISRLLSNQYAPQDLAMQFSQSTNGTYTVQVQENHQSPNMKAKGADPNTSPTIAWFKTNTSGQLLKSTDGGASYQVVGNAY